MLVIEIHEYIPLGSRCGNSRQFRMQRCVCCGKDLSQGEEKKRRRILLKSGYQEIIISLITELEFELNIERINYFCRKCAED